MAKTVKNAPAPTPAAAPAAAPVAAINRALLAMIAAASAVEPNFTHVPFADAASLGGMVEVNNDVKDANGNPAVRVTDSGLEYLAANPAPSPFGTPPAAAPAAPAATPAAAPAPVAAKQTFSVAAFALPERAKRVGGFGGARPEVYPFSTLELGQAFFIAATAKVPNPEKKYASTVTSAVSRFSTDDTTKPQFANRKGRMVYPQIKNRVFEIRKVTAEQAAAGAAAGTWPASWGAPSAGAVIGRTK